MLYWGSHLSHASPLASASFFFNDPATTEIYTLSLHDALPISTLCASASAWSPRTHSFSRARFADRKSTRLNSSHVKISYAVFFWKKKKYTIAILGHYTERSGASEAPSLSCWS